MRLLGHRNDEPVSFRHNPCIDADQQHQFLLFSVDVAPPSGHSNFLPSAATVFKKVHILSLGDFWSFSHKRLHRMRILIIVCILYFNNGYIFPFL